MPYIRFVNIERVSIKKTDSLTNYRRIIMEPVTIIVTALALGAATGIKSVAEQSVKDAYEALKNMIQAKYPNVGVDRLERKPDSETQQAAVKEDIVDVGGDKDVEILQKAKTLLESIENLPVVDLPAIGVNFENIKAGSLNLEDIIATGTGVNVKDGEFQGDITIKKISAGHKSSNNPKG